MTTASRFARSHAGRSSRDSSITHPPPVPNRPSSRCRAIPLGVARGQVAATYIVAEAEDGLVIVDQHAAHERLVLERMRAAREGGAVARQALLIPEVVELDEPDCDRLEGAAAELAEMGLDIERFGPTAMLVRAVPAALGKTDAGGLLADLAAEIAELGGPLSLRDKLDHVAATIACHGSVRAGRVLSRCRNERAAARDGSHAAFRPVQPRPSDLGEARASAKSKEGCCSARARREWGLPSKTRPADGSYGALLK